MYVYNVLMTFFVCAIFARNRVTDYVSFEFFAVQNMYTNEDG